MKKMSVAAWVPRFFDEADIPALRNLAKGGMQIDDVKQQPGLPFHVSCMFVNSPGTLRESNLYRKYELITLLAIGSALAEGPKLFVLPEEMREALDQIEIPIRVSDFAMPFPACIVRSGQEYHFVFQIEGRLMYVVFDEGKCDFGCCLETERTVESFCSDKENYRFIYKDSKEAIGIKDPSIYGEMQSHRFRATLNFLLILTAGGFNIVKPSLRQRQRYKKQQKYTVPTTFAPQDLDLWRKTVISATAETGTGTGSRKRTHWRRAHWRRVAVGQGRTGRELRLIAATLVNQELLVGDVSESRYTVSP